MKIVLFLDLDDTIFQTRAKCPADEPIRPAALRRDGTPLSFMTDRQRVLLNLFFRGATVIPTTARNLDAFRRVDIPFDHAAILDFGGVVLLPGGGLDAEWDALIRPQALALATELRKVHKRLDTWLAEEKLEATARIVSDFDMPLYLVVKNLAGDGSRLAPVRDELVRTMDADRFFLHANDNNLSLVPRFLGKERAVRHVIDRHLGSEPLLTLGMGDSLTDAPFMDLCDFAVMPRGCQIASHRLTPVREP